MIKVNELRIGNLLQSKTGEFISKILMIDSQCSVCSIEDGLCDLDLLEPIPLTKEWLEDFGFNTDSDCWYYYLDWSKQHETFKIAKDEFNNYFLVGQYSKAFKYVHSLQNLYFALTNEELTIIENDKDKD